MKKAIIKPIFHPDNIADDTAIQYFARSREFKVFSIASSLKIFFKKMVYLPSFFLSKLTSHFFASNKNFTYFTELSKEHHVIGSFATSIDS